jgi:hypothetical protein
MQMHQLLVEYLGRRSAAPFDWVAATCFHFAGEWVELVEGWNPMADLPVWRSEAEANELLSSMGGYEAAVTQKLGREAIGSAEARLGDVVMLPLENGRASMGICNGRTVIAIAGTGAVLHLPMPQDSVAWRVEVAC